MVCAPRLNCSREQYHNFARASVATKSCMVLAGVANAAIISYADLGLLATGTTLKVSLAAGAVSGAFLGTIAIAGVGLSSYLWGSDEASCAGSTCTKLLIGSADLLVSTVALQQLSSYVGSSLLLESAGLLTSINALVGSGLLACTYCVYLKCENLRVDVIQIEGLVEAPAQERMDPPPSLAWQIEPDAHIVWEDVLGEGLSGPEGYIREHAEIHRHWASVDLS